MSRTFNKGNIVKNGARKRLTREKFFKHLKKLKLHGWKAYFMEGEIRLTPSDRLGCYCPITAIHFFLIRKQMPMSEFLNAGVELRMRESVVLSIANAADYSRNMTSYEKNIRSKIISIFKDDLEQVA